MLPTVFGMSPQWRFKTYLFKVICLKNRKIAVLFVSTLHWGHNSMRCVKENNVVYYTMKNVEIGLHSNTLCFLHTYCLMLTGQNGVCVCAGLS